MAKQAPLIKRSSRLQFAEFLNDLDGDQNGFDFFELTEYPEIEAQTDDIVYLVKTTDRMDLLAYRYYQDCVLWWVIAVANNMELLPDDLQEGETIIIPSPRYVLNDLFKSVNF